MNKKSKHRIGTMASNTSHAYIWYVIVIGETDRRSCDWPEPHEFIDDVNLEIKSRNLHSRWLPFMSIVTAKNIDE